MVKKLLIAAIPLIALLGGGAGGMMLRPAADDAEAPSIEGGSAAETAGEPAGEPSTTPGPDQGGGKETASAEAEGVADGGAKEYFRFPTQFFVPVVKDGTLGSVMVLTLTLEMPAPLLDKVSAQEYRLRDTLLRALLIEANTGAFDGNFTTDAQMTRLHATLLRAVQGVTGPDVTDVLIGDIARQTS